jgi:hypothetical protein
MSKINQAVVQKYFNNGKKVVKTIIIDAETFEVTLQTRLTKQMEEKIIENIKHLSEIFENETDIETTNHIMLTVTILDALTDIEMPLEKDELVAFLGDFISSGLGDQVFALLDEECEQAVTQINKFMINLAKVVDRFGEKTNGSNGKNKS